MCQRYKIELSPHSGSVYRPMNTGASTDLGLTVCYDELVWKKVTHIGYDMHMPLPDTTTVF